MFHPKTDRFSDERLSIGVRQLPPSLTEHSTDLRVMQRRSHDRNLATFYLQVTQMQNTYINNSYVLYFTYL